MSTPNKSTPKVTVVDALMGSGKTEHAIRMLQRIASPFNESGQKFIYITPFLAEVGRVRDKVLDTIDPKGSRKTEHLYELIGMGRNIVATHKLFEYLDPRAMGQLELSDYVLVFDEVTDWVQPYTGMKLVDVKMLVDTGFISVNPATKRVMWSDVGGTEYDGKFANFRSLCLQGKIVATSVRRDGVPAMILWTLPVEVLELFTETWVLTYLFEGSDVAAYLKLHDIPYKLMTMDNAYNLVGCSECHDAERIAARAELITLTEDLRLNAIGKKLKGEGEPLGKSWYERDAKAGGVKAGQIKTNLRQFFQRVSQTEAHHNLWCVYSPFVEDLKGKGYTYSLEDVINDGEVILNPDTGEVLRERKPCFLAWNSRSTNAYRHKTAIAYCVSPNHGFRRELVAGLLESPSLGNTGAHSIDRPAQA